MSPDASVRFAGFPGQLSTVFPQSRTESRTALLNAVTVQTFAPGQRIFRQGDDTPVALVLDGHVAIRRTSLDGRQLIFRIVGQGKLAAFFPLKARPSAADAIALTEASIALWTGSWFRSLATLDSGLAVDLLDHVLLTYEDVVGRLDSLLYQDALRRVARILNLHADLFFADQPVLTRDYLPNLVGTSREMTGRVLRVLESRALVTRVGRDRLRLLDAAGLAAVAGEQPGS